MNSQSLKHAFKITSEPNELTHGLFGQSLTWVLESLVQLEREGIDPSVTSWNINTRSYGCIIPGVIIPKASTSNASANNHANTLSMVHLKQSAGEPFALEEKSFRQAHDLFHRWFSIEPSILERVPEEINDQWLGIHYRGTDKQLDQLETEPVSRDHFLTLIIDFCNQREFEGLFVCSDEEGFVDDVAHALPHLKITSIDQTRSKNGGALHFHYIPGNDDDKLSMASYAMSDVVGLSRCGHVLKCSSALSAWAKILQPNCQLHQVAITRHPWFPLSVVNTYQAQSVSAQKIMNRVKV